jgi:hypothetical protein
MPACPGDASLPFASTRQGHESNVSSAHPLLAPETVVWSCRAAPRPSQSVRTVPAAAASQAHLLPGVSTAKTMTDLDPESAFRRELSERPLEDRLADVCAGCGLHILLDTGERLQWLKEGGTIQCPRCKQRKTR